MRILAIVAMAGLGACQTPDAVHVPPTGPFRTVTAANGVRLDVADDPAAGVAVVRREAVENVVRHLSLTAVLITEAVGPTDDDYAQVVAELARLTGRSSCLPTAIQRASTHLAVVYYRCEEAKPDVSERARAAR